MLFEYQGFSRKGGIYRIKNTVSGVVYVGSAKRFKERWGDHARSLEQGKHHTKHLQNAYSKYILECGNDDFLEFAVLEVMENATKAERLVREEWWIHKYLNDGLELYNTNKTPTKESAKSSVGCNKGIRHSPATEYKPGNVPWSKENGHDEDTRKLIGEKSKVMWANPEAAEKLLKSRRSEKFRKTRSRDMKESWEKTREQRLIAMNTPECIEAKMAWRKTNKEAEKKRIENSYSLEALKKRLVSLLGQEKAEKILNVDWLKSNVEMYGFKRTAGLIGVDRQTIKRWHEKLCK
jgi:group I intron endonuclease